MKLVNPVGRYVSTFETEANYPCGCYCSILSENQSYGGSMYAACACQCSYGSTNYNSNDNLAKAARS